MYSLDGKAKTVRRRKNPRGSNNSSGTSPPGEASSDTQGASKEGQDSTSKVREQEERATSATEQARQSGNVMQDMTDIFTAGSSPTGSFEGDFVLPDEVLNSFLPDVRGQGVYEYLNASNLPSQTEIDREAMFLDGVFELDRVDSMNTDPAPCTSPSYQNLRLLFVCSSKTLTADTSMTNAPIGATMNAEVSANSYTYFRPLSSHSQPCQDTVNSADRPW